MEKVVGNGKAVVGVSALIAKHLPQSFPVDPLKACFFCLCLYYRILWELHNKLLNFLANEKSS